MPNNKTRIHKQIENFIYIIRGQKVMLDEDLVSTPSILSSVVHHHIFAPSCHAP